MTGRKLAMPDYIADLVHMPLIRLGLDTFSGDDLITCPLTYEDGTELSMAIMCVANRGWFREKAVLLVTPGASGPRYEGCERVFVEHDRIARKDPMI